jgi:hypothetical protein
MGEHIVKHRHTFKTALGRTAAILWNINSGKGKSIESFILDCSLLFTFHDALNYEYEYECKAFPNIQGCG